MAVHEVSGTSRGQAPEVLRRWGAIGWAVVGVFLGIMAILIGFRATSGIVVPVVAALILAVMTLPLTNWLDRFMPRGVAVGLVVLLVAAAGLGLALVFIKGVAEQVPAIQQSIQDGIAKLEDAFNIDPKSTTGSSASQTGASASSIVAGLKGLTGFLVASIDSMVSLLFGLFIGAMVFFLVLLNPHEAQGWVSRLLPWPQEQSKRLFTTSGQVIFDYYKGCTILAMVNAFPIWIVALALDIQAAGAIFVVLFVSSYIPYVGAWIGGAFAVIMALGSGGTTDGWIMLAAVLIVNLGLQSVIQPFAFGATMKVSPLGVFLFTLFGGLVGGVLGAMMAAPILALITRFNTDVRLPAQPPDAPSRADSGGAVPVPVPGGG
jgi:predicted PurR-regulated permease PerM